ncbi:Peptidoglycan-binding Lysin subgroup [Corchorus olitorius]|uniref:Peptidoglycan-binding Lysin subgroup n=1 Tax=Corchorus olitorius TaxID=93759 RepID=A0A1R3GVA0_9ROSI|nr:Peptidoglycan-binding Lysin subgroup [Corchorus olitorius]
MGISLQPNYVIYTLLLILILSVNGQQQYLNNQQLNCDQSNGSVSKAKGYYCDGIQRSCASFLTFRSRPPHYDSPETIATLLGSDATKIASINNVSTTTTYNKLDADKIVIVPITCSCWGSLYQHVAPYKVNAGDSYFIIANNTYQGLTTCQALDGQNFYNSESLQVGAQISVPLRCACPSQNQMANDHVAFLLSYIVTWGDSVSSIAQVFGAHVQSILAANNLTEDDLIFPFAPLLIPMKSESCLENPANLLCSCPNGQYAYELEDGRICASQDKNSEAFPLKLVTVLG